MTPKQKLIKDGSPVSDDGRGLKQFLGCCRRVFAPGSPVSDDGRGLKRMVASVSTPI